MIEMYFIQNIRENVSITELTITIPISDGYFLIFNQYGTLAVLSFVSSPLSYEDWP